MNRLIPLAAVIVLAGCTPAQVSSFNKTVAEGQLFCLIAQTAGPLTVMAMDAGGAPISVIGQAAGTVARVCQVIGGIPVMPPANPAATPQVAIPVVVAPVKG